MPFYSFVEFWIYFFIPLQPIQPIPDGVLESQNNNGLVWFERNSDIGGRKDVDVYRKPRSVSQSAGPLSVPSSV